MALSGPAPSGSSPKRAAGVTTTAKGDPSTSIAPGAADTFSESRANASLDPAPLALDPGPPGLKKRLHRAVSAVLRLGGPETATFRSADRAVVTDVPRALLAQLLPPTLGAVLADVILPRMLFESARNLTAHRAPGPALQGDLRVAEAAGPANYHVTPESRSSGLRVSGEGRDFNVGLGVDKHGAPIFMLDGDFGGRQGTVSLPVSAWSDESGARTSVFQIDPDREVWTTRGQDVNRLRLLATLRQNASPVARWATAAVQGGDGIRPAPTDLQKLLRESNPLPLSRFAIRYEPMDRTGHRVTNEYSSAFPQFSVRGGAYLGVGSQQNYDHLTAARSEAVFLIDLDRRVIADHRGVLTLVGQSRDPIHFLHMLFGVRPSEKTLTMSPTEFLQSVVANKRVKSRTVQFQPDRAYQDEVCEALKPRLSASELKDVRRIMQEAPTVFEPWTYRYAGGIQGQWLTEPERFNHLKYLQNSGRIVIKQGSLTGATMMADLSKALARWNQGHSPPLQLNAIYLSNAEGWIGAGYPKMLSNLHQLPLNPEGVILRTGTNIPGPKGPQGSWVYQTMSMSDFLSVKGAKYHHDLDRAIGDANAKHEAREAELRRLAEDG